MWTRTRYPTRFRATNHLGLRVHNKWAGLTFLGVYSQYFHFARPSNRLVAFLHTGKSGPRFERETVFFVCSFDSSPKFYRIIFRSARRVRPLRLGAE